MNLANNGAADRCPAVITVARTWKEASTARWTPVVRPHMATQTAMMRPGPSRDYYLKKRAEGLLHTQALLALARRRVDGLGAMLRDKRHFTPTPPAPQPAWHHHRDPLDQGVRQVECGRIGDQLGSCACGLRL
jgi:hypothetical protein